MDRRRFVTATALGTAGGLGTGSAERRKDGRFHNFTCFNNEPQFTGPRLPWPQDSILFFVVRYQLPGREPRLKLLQIESERHEQGAVEMALYEMPWLSGRSRSSSRQ